MTFGIEGHNMRPQTAKETVQDMKDRGSRTNTNKPKFIYILDSSISA